MKFLIFLTVLITALIAFSEGSPGAASAAAAAASGGASRSSAASAATSNRMNNAILPTNFGSSPFAVANPYYMQPFVQTHAGIPQIPVNYNPHSFQLANTAPDSTQRPPTPSLNQINLGENSERVRCPHCNESIATNLTYSVGGTALYFALLTVLVFFPLVWIPFVMKVSKDVNHSCPTCGKKLGQYRRSIYDVYGIKIPATPTIDMRVFYQNQ